jgi:hypothetical protein
MWNNTIVANRIVNENKIRGIETIDRKDHQVQCTVYYRYISYIDTVRIDTVRIDTARIDTARIDTVRIVLSVLV